jgi:hypothetical protein
MTSDTPVQPISPLRSRMIGIYRTADERQADRDAWIAEYNERRPHQGRGCLGKTPMQTFLDALPLAIEKIIAA